MNIALWIIAALLALTFLGSGASKLALSNQKLAASGLGWAESYSTGGVKTIGILEVLGAVGLILPAATGVAPILVPLAAAGLAAMMIGAVVTHVRRHELQGIVVSGILLVLTLVLIWGRLAVPAAGN